MRDIHASFSIRCPIRLKIGLWPEPSSTTLQERAVHENGTVDKTNDFENWSSLLSGILSDFLKQYNS